MRRRAARARVRGELRRFRRTCRLGYRQPRRSSSGNADGARGVLGAYGHRAAVRGHRARRRGRGRALGGRHHPVGRRQGRRGRHLRGRALGRRVRLASTRRHRAAHHLRGAASAGFERAGRRPAARGRALLRVGRRRRSGHHHHGRPVPLVAQRDVLGTRRACGRVPRRGRVGHRHGRRGRLVHAARPARRGHHGERRVHRGRRRDERRAGHVRGSAARCTPSAPRLRKRP